MDMLGGNTIMLYLVMSLLRSWGEGGEFPHHLEDLRTRRSENPNTILPIHSAPHFKKERTHLHPRPSLVLVLQPEILRHIPLVLTHPTQRPQDSFVSPPKAWLYRPWQTILQQQGLSAAVKAPASRRKENIYVQCVGNHSCDLQALLFIIAPILGRSRFCVQSHPANARQQQKHLL